MNALEYGKLVAHGLAIARNFTAMSQIIRSWKYEETNPADREIMDIVLKAFKEFNKVAPPLTKRFSELQTAEGIPQLEEMIE